MMYEDVGSVVGCGLLVVVIAVIVASALFFPITYETYRDGSHVGYVTAVDNTGIFGWNKYVVYFKTSLESTQEDEYCVPLTDGELAEQLRQYAVNNTRVEVRYNGIARLGFNYERCSGAIINAVNPASE